MKTTNKKLQLKKETMALLNDPKMENINGGGLPGGGGVPGMPGVPSAGYCTAGCSDGPICGAFTMRTNLNCTKYQCTADCY